MDLKLKRNKEVLKPLTSEHREVLDLCSKISKGLRSQVDTKRIKRYADWFMEDYLNPHFELEKKYVFPILGNQNFRVKRALANHRRLNRLFDETSNLKIVLNKIEEELATYIRFEERVLFNEIKTVANETQLEEIEKNHHKLKFSDSDWQDRFWLS